MATSIQLDVDVNKGKAIADLSVIEAELKKLNSTVTSIKFKTEGAKEALSAAQQVEIQNKKTEASTQRRITAEKNLEAAQTRRSTAKINAASKEEQANARAALSAQKHAEKMEELAARTDKATAASNAFSVALGALAARAVHLALSKITQGIREAINEMKEVDTQLTNISKVSGITGKALSDMGERAYETASKYGVAADEYLAAVYTFQKAGLNDSAEAMGELAVKTMLVGDTTADVATQFLISANAAWKFGGDMERLGQIVDEADYINNNYATDLGKLSSGLPRVASIAAQAGMSAEETLAALGTITAVTQESGTKAATALRALILNIEGKVGEFVDETGEEFKVTEESVKSMQGLMEKYAKAEIEAAKASGELINPMTAIKAIFEGMANSDLNDQELFTLLSSMGGKLRTNQLTALVQNYKLFDEMLQKIAGSAGTADNEISLMMDSWERKTQVLKNTWTEFIADVVNTDFIKDTIEGVTDLVRALDEVVDRSNDPWFESNKTKDEIADIESRISSIAGEIKNLRTSGDLGSPKKIHDLEVELQLQKEILETKRLQYELEKKQEAEKLQKELTRGYLDLSGTYTSVDVEEIATIERRLGGVTFEGSISEYQAHLKEIVADFSDYYEKVIQVRDAGAELTSSQEAFIQYYEHANSLAETQTLHVGQLVDGYWQLFDASGNVVAQVKDITAEQDALQASLRNALDTAEDAPDATKTLLDYLADIAYYLGQYEASIGSAGDEVENLNANESDAAETASDIGTNASDIDFSGAVGDAEALARALAAADAAASGLSLGAGFGFATGTTNAPGGPTLVNELGPELISENGRAYIANGGRPGVVNLSRGAIVLPASVTKQALRGNGKGRSIHAAASGTPNTILVIGGSTASHSTAGGARDFVIDPGRQAAMDAAAAYNSPWTCPKCKTVNPGGYAVCQKCGAPNPKKAQKKTGGGGGGGKGGGGSSSGPSISQLAKDLSDLLSNLDKQAKLANNEGDYVREVQIYEQAQEAIKKMVDDYRRAGYADDSDEILDLLNKNYDYANKQLSLYQSKWDELIKALEADTDAQEMANKLAEKQQAVEDAREALANAQRQRTVRMYNAATGQWEWVSDNKTVSKAQESLTKAEEAYAKELKSQAITELKNAKEAGLALEDIVLGPALSAVALMAEETDEFQNFARALNAVYGVGSFLQSTEGSSNVISTADSHDVHYTFGNVTLTEEQASSMSVAELAKKLSVLNIS